MIIKKSKRYMIIRHTLKILLDHWWNNWFSNAVYSLSFKKDIGNSTVKCDCTYSCKVNNLSKSCTQITKLDCCYSRFEIQEILKLLNLPLKIDITIWLKFLQIFYLVYMVGNLEKKIELRFLRNLIFLK